MCSSKCNSTQVGAISCSTLNPKRHPSRAPFKLTSPAHLCPPWPTKRGLATGLIPARHGEVVSPSHCSGRPPNLWTHLPTLQDRAPSSRFVILAGLLSSLAVFGDTPRQVGARWGLHPWLLFRLVNRLEEGVRRGCRVSVRRNIHRRGKKNRSRSSRQVLDLHGVSASAAGIGSRINTFSTFLARRVCVCEVGGETRERTALCGEVVVDYGSLRTLPGDVKQLLG